MLKSTVYAVIMGLAILLVICMVPIVALEKVLSAAVRHLVAVGSLILNGVCND